MEILVTILAVLIVFNVIIQLGMISFMMRMANALTETRAELGDQVDDVYLAVVNPRRLRAKKEASGLVEVK